MLSREETEQRKLDSGISFLFLFPSSILLSLLSRFAAEVGRRDKKKKGVHRNERVNGEMTESTFRLKSINKTKYFTFGMDFVY